MVSHLQTTKKDALLAIPKCKRDDTGQYRVLLSNPSGNAEASIKVNVLGEAIEVVILLFHGRPVYHDLLEICCYF